MSKTRKISDCINLRISLGNYQHIEFIKYSEEQIEYSSEEERQKQEDSLHADLVDSLIRSVRETPARFKGNGQAQEVEESIKKKIPEWLKKNAVPNIANGGAKREIQIQATQQETVDCNNAFLDTDKNDKKPVATKAATKAATPSVNAKKDDDLFEGDEKPTAISESTDDLFDDEPTPHKKVEVVVPKVEVKKEVKAEVKKETPKAETPKVEDTKTKTDSIDAFGTDDFDTDDFLK